MKAIAKYEKMIYYICIVTTNEFQGANFSVVEEEKNHTFVIYPWDLIKLYKFNTEEKYVITS